MLIRLHSGTRPASIEAGLAPRDAADLTRVTTPSTPRRRPSRGRSGVDCEQLRRLKATASRSSYAAIRWLGDRRLLLERLDLAGALVTLDAMGTQRRRRPPSPKPLSGEAGTTCSRSRPTARRPTTTWSASSPIHRPAWCIRPTAPPMPITGASRNVATPCATTCRGCGPIGDMPTSPAFPIWR